MLATYIDCEERLKSTLKQAVADRRNIDSEDSVRKPTALSLGTGSEVLPCEADDGIAGIVAADGRLRLTIDVS